MDEEPKSLRALFASAKSQKNKLESTSNINDPAYKDQFNSAVQAFEACQKLISKLSIFSPNESLEDIATVDLQYVTVDYLFAELLQRSHGLDRVKNVQRTRGEYERFLELLDQYGILSPADKKLFEKYLESPDSFSLAPLNDAAARRQVKINRFREETELKQKLENQRPIEKDDDVVRQLYLAEINLYIHQALQSLDMLSQELSMLKAAQRVESAHPPEPPRDARRADENNTSGYSDRLDIGVSPGDRERGRPLLSTTGVPLQPFVLTSRRAEIQRGVFRPGHNLPTMTIEEYLEEERKRGGIIEGGGEQSGAPKEIDEDEMDKADEETMKARAWDEFKEENPRGSGNTINRG
ncbi:Type 2A phosphatase-associated protein 42 [Emydomyces testavorans]|uniref:Type 2A phosphatase-associated protein 42 n=1 Tax=Emydomyces testavorans TaxID=2070801 RepID=A0AAF0DP60_9EURO|nr:Type 2A phosphatase-associated protein 42 [Emydomyces testavorans]